MSEAKKNPNTDIVVTKHAEERMRERLGISRAACKRMASIAYSKGVVVTSSDINTRLKDIIEHKISNHSKGSATRIYGYFVYVFENNTLITVIPINNKLRKSADKLIGIRPKRYSNKQNNIDE